MRIAAEAFVLSVLCIVGCGKGSPSTPATGPAPAFGGGTSGGSATPAPGWRASLAGATIPDVPVFGQIHGEPFTVEIAEIQNGILHLKQGKEFFANKEFTVFLFLKEEGSIPEMKSWSVKADKEFVELVVGTIWEC